MRHKWILISFVLFAVAGVLLAYPLVSTIINSKYHSDIETAYTTAIEDSNADELEQQRQAAQQYNAMLSGAAITEGGASAPPLAYAQQLTVGGVMAYVDIPPIGVYLPVQHGTDADTLEKSVGHVVGTSLPVGGSSTHAVLSAHSGMANSKLFSDIDQLAADDMFYIHVLGEALAYRVRYRADRTPQQSRRNAKHLPGIRLYRHYGGSPQSAVYRQTERQSHNEGAYP